MTETENFAETILRKLPQLVYIHDIVNRQNIFATNEIISLLGYTPQEVRELDSTTDLIHPDDLAETEAHFVRMAESPDGVVHENTYRMRHKDGNWHWLRSRETPFARNKEGQVVQVVGSVEDVTQNKWTERLLNSVASYIYVYNVVEQSNVWSNADLAELLGYSQSEMRAAGDAFLPSVLHPDDLTQLAQWQAQIIQLADGEILEIEYRVRGPNGMWLWFQDRIVPFTRDTSGQVIEYLGAVQDITSLKEARNEQVTLQERVINAQRDAIRELSTPLIPIIEGVVVMPLIGIMNSDRAQRILETLLSGVAEHQAYLVIIDITGVRDVDTQIAQVLVHAAQAVRLLGSRVMLTGIQPQIAQTLIELGADLSGIITQSTLQRGIATALSVRNEVVKH
ncbi:MAG: PAS domain-containing protein [Chloroflexota bacterium]